MAKFSTVNDILNRVGAEVGLRPVSDPYTNDSFRQMRYLLDSAGQELVELAVWPDLVKNHQITTTGVDSGDYTLPSDFAYMIDQTGWEHTNENPLVGPATEQQWSYLVGSDFDSATIHVIFRLNAGNFSIYPRPPLAGLDINFSYMSRNWVLDASDSDNPVDLSTDGGDTVRFDTILFIKFLKAKYLEAKGFDSTKTREEFGYMFDSRSGKEKGAPILNAGSSARNYPFLNPMRNVNDTGYGS